MLHFSKQSLAGLTLAAGIALALTGCQSTGTGGGGGDGSSSAKPAADAMPGTPTTEAIACDKCKTVWVQYPTAPNASGGRSYIFRGYTQPGQMVCAQCQQSVETMFATGNMQQKCPDCGGNMRPAMAH